ncbi:hypothetical protein I2W78_15110 [Streptomyces spinoverrucosus]|uniref:hypothetical protein n=1 Tax=Streptomyces spinoverrucosus TaxID=284043 RepID=UPI0018C440B1|nr:hypothetical protein [Streptomyces spinoverrucosus]MBG0853143.1 hypothetical protein [Streptomyces spinoverrucosus]
MVGFGEFQDAGELGGVGPADGESFLLAIESQKKRNRKKELTWPYYVAYLQSKYGLPVLLTVVCGRATASGPPARSTAQRVAGPCSGRIRWSWVRTMFR